MKKPNFNHINWLVLSLMGLTCVYVIFTNNFETESYMRHWNYKYRIGNELEPFIKNNGSFTIELLKPKTDNLWRFLNKVNRSIDKVSELMKWTENISHSDYLRNASPKKILVFNGINSFYGTEEGKLKCPFNHSALLTEKCIIKEDKLLDVTNYAGYDAFVSVRNWKHVIYDRKIPSVKHILYIQESPFVVKYADLSINNAILASYWRGSDIVLPYGYFSKFQDHQKQTVVPQDSSKNYAEGKTQLAAIIVSNCEAKNDRLRYVHDLGIHIPVHIYGSCGPYDCHESCLERVKKVYKFYLSFEKANCKDYITEKFWYNALEFDAIPIVMGAHPQDYKDLAPPNSYIHVEDFDSPKDLADYLIKLDKNDDLYNEYFKWKRIGKVKSVWQEFFCRLCGILFYGDFVEPPFWKPKSTWESVNRCLPLKQWYWTRKI